MKPSIAFVAAAILATTTLQAQAEKMRYEDVNARRVVEKIGYDCTEYGRAGRWLPLAATHELGSGLWDYQPIAKTVDSRWVRIYWRIKDNDGNWQNIDASKVSTSGAVTPRPNRQGIQDGCAGFPYDATIPMD